MLEGIRTYTNAAPKAGKLEVPATLIFSLKSDPKAPQTSKTESPATLVTISQHAAKAAQGAKLEQSPLLKTEKRASHEVVREKDGSTRTVTTIYSADGQPMLTLPPKAPSVSSGSLQNFAAAASYQHQQQDMNSRLLNEAA